MGLRDRANQRIPERLEPQTAVVDEVADIDPVGQKRLAAAEIQPVHVVPRIFEEIAEELFVIAAKRDAAQGRRRWLQQMLENTAGIPATIDIVAQKNNQSGGWIACEIGKDFLFRLQKQIEAAMDVANGIDRKRRRLVAEVYSAPPPVVAGGWLFTTANPV